MLDNLKLGYGGTKTEMERLISDAAKLDKSVKANDLSFGNIVKAIHAVQTEMGITGTTTLEAEKTISGSFNMMKAAASNFMVSLVSDNGDVSGSFEVLKETAVTFFDNVKPRVLEFLKAISPMATAIAGITAAFVAFKISAAISGLLSTLTRSWQAYKTANDGATISQWAINAAMTANPIGIIVALIAGLVAALVVLWNTNDDFKEAITKAWDAIGNTAKKVWGSVADFFTETIPNAFQSVIDWFKDVGDWFADIGKNIIDGIKKGISNAWDNMVEWFKGLFGDLIGIAKKILGIKSPSRVFKVIGKYVDEGLKEGLEQGADEVYRTVSDISDGVIDNFDADLEPDYGITTSMTSMSDFSGGSPDYGYGGSQNVNVTVGIDNGVNAMGLARALLPFLKIAEKEVYA